MKSLRGCRTGSIAADKRSVLTIRLLLAMVKVDFGLWVNLLRGVSLFVLKKLPQPKTRREQQLWGSIL